MGVRRQIYLTDADDGLLEERSRSTGISVSELVRRAVQANYGAGRRLSWTEVFDRPLQPRSLNPEEDAWVYDPLLDEEIDAAVEASGRDVAEDPA